MEQLPIENTLTFAIGDIHGMFKHLKQLTEFCADYAERAGSKPRFITLGDYVDRGPDTKQCIDYLMNFPYPLIPLMGNHEDMMLDSYNLSRWLNNGGTETMNSYSSSDGQAPAEHKEWMKSLKLIHEDQYRIYVHAGLNPGREFKDQIRADMLWIREAFLKSEKDWGKLVVHGHTPYDPGNPRQPGMQWGHNKVRLNLDTACVFGRSLTAAIFNDLQRDPIGYLQVDKELINTFRVD